MQFRPFAISAVELSHTLGRDNWIRLDQAEAMVVACSECNMTLHGIRALVTVDSDERIYCQSCAKDAQNIEHEGN